MEWTIPGTVLTGRRERPDIVEDQIRAMFRMGGIIRSQMSRVTGLESHAIQNWVKRGFVSSPVDKRYSLRQFCRIVIIHMLKNAMPMERICSLLGYINGQLDDESDDSIDDSELYFAFLRVASEYRGMVEDRQALRQCVRENLREYREPTPGARERVEQVLMVMITAWTASILQKEAELLYDQLALEKGETNHG